MPRSRRAARLLFALSVTLAACSTDSCGCDAFEARTFPTSKLNVTIPAAGQVRVTQSGLDFVEAQIPYLMSQVLPGGLNFCIPRDTSGNPDLCVDSTCTGGANGCQVNLQLADQTITPRSPDTVEVEIVIGDINERLNFDYDAGLFTVNCYVQLFKDGASEATPGTVTGTVPIRIFADQARDTKDVGVDVGDVALDLTDVDFKIHGRGNVGDTIACEGASLVRGLFRGRIESEIRTALGNAVDDIREAQLCQHCSTSADCPGTATCTAGICQYATSCAPRTLGIEGRLDLAVPGLVGAVRATTPRADFMGKAADLARVDTGVTVGLRGGAEPVAVSDCVPVALESRPPIPTIPPSTAITGNSRPGGGPFMLGLGLHKSVIEQALWSIWASGATCLNVSGEDLMALSTTTFHLAAPSLKDISGPGQPAMIGFVANHPPRVELGANRVTPSGATYVIDEPLLNIIWDDLDLHVFGHAQDRLTRLLTIRLDLELPVAMAYDGRQLVPIVADIEAAIANVEVRRTELVSETDEQILDAVPTFLAVAGPYLDYGLPDAIAVPEFLGFRLDMTQADITSVDNGQFVAVFARLARTTSPYTAVANTAILGQQVAYDRVLPSGFVRPEVALDVVGYETNPFEGGPDYEFSWRVDGGLWSMYQRSSTLVVGDAILAIEGEHTIEVRARRIGEMATQDPTPAVTIVDIAWSPAAPQAMGPTAQGRVPAAPVLRKPAVASTSSPGMRLGCSSANGGAGGLAPLLLVAVVFAGRRRRRRLVAMIVCLGALQLGCWKGCQGELRTNADQFCLGPECIVDQACTIDGDCAGLCPAGASGICDNEACRCVTACEPGCGADEFCCIATSACVPYGDLCTETSCDPGYEPGVTQATPDRENCALTDFTCDCVPLPPVPIGWHGAHGSIDSDGGLTVVATYNKTYGDLMLGVVQPDASVAWHFVDGVPTDAPIVGDPGGLRAGRDERGPQVGQHTAVALAAGRAHVFYRDEDADALKWGVATFGDDGSVKFESAVVDPTPGVGYWTAAVSAGSRVHVVYALPRGDAGSEVRHLAVDANGTPSGGSPTTILSSTTVWDGKGYPTVAGAFFDLTASGDTPFLVFYDGTSDRVGRTQFDGTAWADPQFVAAGTGPWASGWLDADGLQHVVFMQPSGLRYSRFGDVATSQVDDGLRDLDDDYWTGTVGEDSVLRVGAGGIDVAYHDAFDRTLVVSSSADGASGSWTHARHDLAGTGSGFWIAMTRRGERFVADMVIDRASEAGAYLRVSPY